MRFEYVIITMLMFLIMDGCHEQILNIDLTPPSIPQELSTATGDNLTELFWNKNPESDVAGYHVFVSNAYDGKYLLIGTTTQPYFVDRGSRNGYTYYYAVTAYDVSGNESPLSAEVAYNTPRPEGYGVILNDYHTASDAAGYDFSTYFVGLYNDKYTDVFFEYYNGVYYMDVWEDSDIQDMGYTASLYVIIESPTAGWSPSKDVQLIVGHTYVVWTWDNHYAKIRIKSLSPTRVVFDWTYQLQSGNTMLKQVTGNDRGSLMMGSGATNRQ